MAQTPRNSKKRAREHSSLYRDHGDGNDDQTYGVAAMTTRTLEASSSSREARAEHHDPPAVPNSCNTDITSRSLRKGMVILKGFLSFGEQEELTGFSPPLVRQRSGCPPPSPNLVRTHLIENYQALRDSAPCLSRGATLPKGTKLEPGRGAHLETPSSANHTAAASQPTGRIAKASWLHLSRAHAHQLGRLPEGGFYLCHNEKTKRMRMMNLGLRTDGGRHKLRIPQAWTETAVRACRAAAELDASIPILRPDICVVNHYTVESRLGWHQDLLSSRDPGLPVVSLSLGEPATFQYRLSWRKTSGVKSVTLESGDAFVFGGRSRGIIHAVPGIGKSAAAAAAAAAAASNSVVTTIKARFFRSSPSEDGRSGLAAEGREEETSRASLCRVPGGGRYNLNFREL